MNQPHINIGCVSNLYVRQMHFLKAGDTEQGHAHVFDHLTLLASGSLKVTVEGQETVFKAPHMIYIKAGKQHELLAQEDNTTVYCIHALRNADGSGDIIDPESIPAGVDPLNNCSRV